MRSRILPRREASTDLSLRLESTMPFPESPRVVYNKNPLVQVIAQLQFPPILAIAATEPAAFQERIRQNYPLYSQQPAVDVPEDIAGLLQKLNIPPQARGIRHAFATENEKQTVSLTQNFLALEDTAYSRWERFRGEIATLLGALGDIYKPAFFSRIGLRYIDVINPQELGLEDTDWTQLINDKLLGLLADPNLQAEVGESASNTVLSINGLPGGHVRLQHGKRLLETNESRSISTYLIDVDISTQRKTNANDVIPTLNIFNQIAGNLFRWSITPRLQAALQPTRLDAVAVAAG